jgi:flagellar protein FliO/FliZ
MIGNPDPGSFSWLRLMLALSVVAGLLALMALALKYIASGKLSITKMASARRLKLIETLPLDTRRRLAIIRCDGREHLLLLGSGQDIVVESNLPASEIKAQL